jgi:hypothetical protein
MAAPTLVLALLGSLALHAAAQTADQDILNLAINFVCGEVGLVLVLTVR